MDCLIPLDLGVGVQGPHLGSVLLLGGHVQLHCVAVLGEEEGLMGSVDFESG